MPLERVYNNNKNAAAVSSTVVMLVKWGSVSSPSLHISKICSVGSPNALEIIWVCVGGWKGQKRNRKFIVLVCCVGRAVTLDSAHTKLEIFTLHLADLSNSLHHTHFFPSKKGE